MNRTEVRKAPVMVCDKKRFRRGKNLFITAHRTAISPRGLQHTEGWRGRGPGCAGVPPARAHHLASETPAVPRGYGIPEDLYAYAVRFASVMHHSDIGHKDWPYLMNRELP